MAQAAAYTLTRVTLLERQYLAKSVIQFTLKMKQLGPKCSPPMTLKSSPNGNKSPNLVTLKHAQPSSHLLPLTYLLQIYQVAENPSSKQASSKQSKCVTAFPDEIFVLFCKAAFTLERSYAVGYCVLVTSKYFLSFETS